MPRKPRKLSATGIYHIMTRGIDRMAIFHDDEDREKYLEILADCLPGEPDSSGDGSFCHTEGGTEELSSVRKFWAEDGFFRSCAQVGDGSFRSCAQVEDGSLVPASRDKGYRPQPGNCPDSLSGGDGFFCHTEGGTKEPSSARMLQPIPAILYNYCLMGNHVHLLLKTGSEPLSHLMKRISVRYAAFFKWKYHRTGHLFQDRFRSEPVENKAYLLAVYRYITLNPVKAGLCEKPGTYPWCGVTSQNIPDGSLCQSIVQVEDGSLVPASCDKGDHPQPGNCHGDLSGGDGSFCHTEGGTEEPSSMRGFELAPLPVALTREEIWDYICADAPEIHPFAERVLDGEAKDLLLRYANLQNPLDAARLPRNKQIVLFSRLQEEGVSIQQMARLTGIAKTNIARWLS